MPSCVVKWCKSHTDLYTKAEGGVTFHLLPQDPMRRKQWIKAIQFERQESDWMPSKTSKICAIHFKEDDFHLSKRGFTMLNKTAVPNCTMVLSSAKLLPVNPSETRQLTNNIKKWIKVEPGPDDPLDLSPLKALQSKLNNIVSCPSCGHHFGLTSNFDVGKSNEALSPNSLTLTDIKQCNTPPNIFSSDYESAFKTKTLEKKLLHKTFISQKRLSKLKTIRRRNNRLLKKIVLLKDMNKKLRRNNIIDIGLHSTLPKAAGEIFKNIMRRNKMLIKKIVSLKDLNKKLRRNNIIDIGLQNTLPNAGGEILSSMKREDIKGKSAAVAVKKITFTSSIDIV